LGATEVEPLGFFSAELEPWAAYRDLRENMFRLHYQYGRPLVIPLLLHVVPRGIYPDKPQNSAGYVAQALNPIAFENGFAVPSTFAGDLYLNFGIIGVVFGTLFLGSYAGRIDRIAIRRDRQHAGLFILAFGSFPSLLRDSLSSTLFTVASWLVVYWLFSLLARDRLRL
jgi:oligosaccharide repeat unit polymerase